VKKGVGKGGARGGGAESQGRRVRRGEGREKVGRKWGEGGGKSVGSGRVKKGEGGKKHVSGKFIQDPNG